MKRRISIVLSPGVPADLPALNAARGKGIPVWSEIELAWRFLHGRLVAVTGSNGKTTTTSLIAHILKSAGISTVVGGNIGTPLISLIESTDDSTVSVAEVSSFQLEAIEAFRPDIGLLLNLTPDHLDRHRSFEEYARAKLRLFENQRERDAAILNADDPEVAQRVPAKPSIYWFSRQKHVSAGAYVRDAQIIVRDHGDEEIILRRDEIPLLGEHNVENVLAASIATWLAGAEPDAIAEGIRTFPGVEHRIEFVAEVRGVKFYNDSKATNVDATLKAIAAFDSPLLIILGGKDKGSPYTPLREPLQAHTRAAFLIGAAAEKIASELEGVSPARPRRNARSRRPHGLRASRSRRHDSSRPRLLELRSIRKLRASRPHVQAARRRTETAPQRPSRRRRSKPGPLARKQQTTCPESSNPIASSSEPL